MGSKIESKIESHNKMFGSHILIKYNSLQSVHYNKVRYRVIEAEAKVLSKFSTG